MAISNYCFHIVSYPETTTDLLFFKMYVATAAAISASNTILTIEIITVTTVDPEDISSAGQCSGVLKLVWPLTDVLNASSWNSSNVRAKLSLFVTPMCAAA